MATRFPSSPSSRPDAARRDDAPAFSTRPRRDPRDERAAVDDRAPPRFRSNDDDDRGGRDTGFVKNENEQKVAGENACRALFMRRPDDIRRVYVSEEVLPRFKDVLRMCAERKLAYHVKTDADLDQIAETVHHDGVLFLAKKPREHRLDDVFSWIDELLDDDRAVIVLLEDVKNPHNLGAILRVCAHFGVPFVLRAGDTPASSPAVLRTAEGGAEHCALVDVADGAKVLDTLKERGFSVLATSSHATVDLGRERLPARTVVMFGSEGEGLSKALQDRADGVIAIPGSGALESLNVACAASVVLWELWREASRPLPPKAASKPAPAPQRLQAKDRPARDRDSAPRQQTTAPKPSRRWD